MGEYMDTQHAGSPPLAHQRLKYVPLALFTIPMSLAGVGLACQRIEAMAGWREMPSLSLLALAVVSFLLVALAYGAKLVRHPDAVLADWRHPVRMCFFAPAGMTLLLLATALVNGKAPIAWTVWAVGTLGLAVTAGATLSAWIARDTLQPAHLLPVWFLPIVGTCLVPHAGVRLGQLEVSWLFFAFSLLLWLVLLPLILQRLIFGPPLPDAMRPSLAILVAPPALLFIAHVELAGGLQEGGRILFGVTTVFGVLVLVKARWMLRAPFSLTWWSFSFPVAAWTSATLLYSVLASSTFYLLTGRALFFAVLLMTAYLLARTLAALARGDLTRPPPG